MVGVNILGNRSAGILLVCTVLPNAWVTSCKTQKADHAYPPQAHDGITRPWLRRCATESGSPARHSCSNQSLETADHFIFAFCGRVPSLQKCPYNSLSTSSSWSRFASGKQPAWLQNKIYLYRPPPRTSSASGSTSSKRY